MTRTAYDPGLRAKHPTFYDAYGVDFPPKISAAQTPKTAHEVQKNAQQKSMQLRFQLQRLWSMVNSSTQSVDQGVWSQSRHLTLVRMFASHLWEEDFMLSQLFLLVCRSGTSLLTLCTTKAMDILQRRVVKSWGKLLSPLSLVACLVSIENKPG